MNELSQLIYFANVAGNAGFTNGVLSVGLLAGSLVVGLGALFFREEYTRSGEEDVFYGKVRKGCRVWLAVLFPLYIVTLVGGMFIPTKETVYAIAASEMGERIATSETGDKAVKALNAWLDRQIAAAPETVQAEAE